MFKKKTATVEDVKNAWSLDRLKESAAKGYAEGQAEFDAKYEAFVNYDRADFYRSEVDKYTAKAKAHEAAGKEAKAKRCWKIVERMQKKLEDELKD